MGYGVIDDALRIVKEREEVIEVLCLYRLNIQQKVVHVPHDLRPIKGEVSGKTS
jgi:hypothetical protein